MACYAGFLLPRPTILPYVQWVNVFCKALKPYLEGAFINFVDQHLVTNPNTLEGRLELLEIYHRKENQTPVRSSNEHSNV